MLENFTQNNPRIQELKEFHKFSLIGNADLFWLLHAIFELFGFICEVQHAKRQRRNMILYFPLNFTNF